MIYRDPRIWRFNQRLRQWRLRRPVWKQLARIAEASVHRYRNRLPPWLELDELKQQIVASIPRLLTRMPPGFASNSKRMTATEYYIYCRASFAARKVLSSQPRFTSELNDVHGMDNENIRRIEAKELANWHLEPLSPTSRRIILLHYAGRKNSTIARYLGTDVPYVENELARIKYDLGITSESNAEPHEIRMAA